MPKTVMVSAEFARKTLRYDPETGDLFWRPRTVDMFTGLSDRKADQTCRMWNTRYAGQKIAAVDGSGYLQVQFAGLGSHKAHRIIWLIVYGECPKEIDHIDGDKLNNRLENLRKCDRSQNVWNRKRQKNNTSGFKGVHLHRQTNKWRAMIRVHRIKHDLGLHETPEDAHAAYCEAAARLHGEFARVA